jgi:hypothetical protein
MRRDSDRCDLALLLAPEPKPKGWRAAYSRAFFLLLELRTGLRPDDEFSWLVWYVWRWRRGAKLTRFRRLGIEHALRVARERGQLQQLNLKIDALEDYDSGSHVPGLHERLLIAYRNQLWKRKEFPYMHEIQEEMKTRFPKYATPNEKTIRDYLLKDSLPRNPRGFPKRRKQPEKRV